MRMYVRTYIRTYMYHTCVCRYVRIRSRMYLMYVRTYTYTYVRTYVRAYVRSLSYVCVPENGHDNDPAQYMITCQLAATCRTCIINVRISLYIVCVRLESCIDRQASQSKTALDRSMERSKSRDQNEDVPMYDGAPSRGRDQVQACTGSLPPPAPIPIMSMAIDKPARIRIGVEHHKYIYNQHAGRRLAYRCDRGPDDDRDGSHLWLMQDPAANDKWVALVIIGYGTLLVSQSTWTG